jgi:nucleotide-binding universal stress UspA family protein
MTLAGAERDGTTAMTPRPDTVLLATDLSAVSEAATEQAIDLARRLQGRLLVLNVLETRRLVGIGHHERVDQARAEREPLLAEIVQRARAAGVGAEFLVWTGEPAEAILSAAEAEQAALVVVGSHGRVRAGRLLLGSVSDHLVRNADCPVVVVRPDAGRVAHPGRVAGAEPH